MATICVATICMVTICVATISLATISLATICVATICLFTPAAQRAFTGADFRRGRTLTQQPICVAAISHSYQIVA